MGDAFLKLKLKDQKKSIDILASDSQLSRLNQLKVFGADQMTCPHLAYVVCISHVPGCLNCWRTGLHNDIMQWPSPVIFWSSSSAVS